MKLPASLRKQALKCTHSKLEDIWEAAYLATIIYLVEKGQRQWKKAQKSSQKKKSKLR